MATPEIKNTQIRTGTNIGDMIEVVDVGGSTPGLPNIDASQILNLNTSQITSGTFADARIAQTNITQHESALTITESQITDDSILARLNSDETVTGQWNFEAAVIIDGTGTPEFSVISMHNNSADTKWTFGTNSVTSGLTIGYGSPIADATDPVINFTSSREVVVGNITINNGTYTLTGQNGVYDGDGSRVFSPNNPDIWTVVSSATTATNGNKLLADTSGGAVTITLPSTPSSGDFVLIADPTTSWNTNNLTVDGNGNNVEGATTFVATTDDGAFHTIYNGTQWIIRFGP